MYEMHGNVFEWCSDWYDEYDISITTDPVGAISGSNRVLRGGSWWFVSPGYERSASRVKVSPSFRYGNIGFRFCVRSQNSS
ncbi:formylglycine-generating enzyme family protein [Candidatus Uabimicrobium sp. HlEnr_7]|uniref:formylglycine-generating enzyme family protein n=1 Tax=Candidatus Uabimicrobium helgolandensis TaxID=3095367 RepID=UPI0035589E04